jgi:hypothetical protein
MGNFVKSKTNCLRKLVKMSLNGLLKDKIVKECSETVLDLDIYGLVE